MKEIEDLEKARWYLKKEIKRIKRLEKKKLRKKRGGSFSGPIIIDEIHNLVPGIGAPWSGGPNEAVAATIAEHVGRPRLVNRG